VHFNSATECSDHVTHRRRLCGVRGARAPLPTFWPWAHPATRPLNNSHFCSPRMRFTVPQRQKLSAARGFVPEPTGEFTTLRPHSRLGGRAPSTDPSTRRLRHLDHRVIGAQSGRTPSTFSASGRLCDVIVVRCLGSYLVSDVSMRSQVARTLIRLRVFHSLVAFLVLMSLDYDSATLVGIPSFSYILCKRCSCSTCVSHYSRSDHITSHLYRLHWLRAPERRGN